MADNTPNSICGANAAGPTHATGGTANVSGDQHLVNWPEASGNGTFAPPPPVTGQTIADTDIIETLIQKVNTEISRYTQTPRHNESGGTIYYSGGSNMNDLIDTNGAYYFSGSATIQTIISKPGTTVQYLNGSPIPTITDTATGIIYSPINRDQQPVLADVWLNVVNKTIALENAWGMVSNTISNSPVYKNDGPDIVDSNYIQSVISALNGVSGMTGCGTVCKCNVVCACNGNCGCNYSDEQLKIEIEPIDPRLIDTFTPVKFKYDPKKLGEQDDGKHHYGILAQNLLGTELEKSGMLHTAEYGHYKVNYTEIIGILIAESQSLRRENMALLTRLNTIEASVSRLDRTFK